MDDDRKEKLLEQAFWASYGALMESLRRGETLALARWGRPANGVLPRPDGREVQAMQQLRQGLEALWVGFEE